MVAPCGLSDMKIEGRFSGKTAIVTGGASGSGKAVAARIAAEGGTVSLWDANPSTLESAQAETGAAHIAHVDVTDYDAVAVCAEETNAKLGRIDMLVCSAGITGATIPVVQYPIDEWKRVLAINLDGVFHCCRAIVPYMTANAYGRIVNMSSVGGKEGNPNASAYAASKAGVIGFTKALGKELATSGVLVNAVTPAVFRTPLLEQMPQSQIDYMVAKIPMGRVGEVDEVSALVCWLLSEECSFSTGAVFDMSGGRSTY
jgi:NAD(P)-dependent dehydrogenase (short-subunit alcohol dehydrogenase family)